MESKALTEQGIEQASVLDRLPFSLTQLIAVAMQRPRNQMAAMDDALAQLRANPESASKSYYSIPFNRYVDGRKVTELVEGPSIKAATALSGCWGNNIEGGFMGQETDDYVDVFGYFFDYQTGKMTIRSWRVSKTYRTKDGKVVPWRYDMLQKQIQAGLSKAIRNADLAGLPAGYVATYYQEAKAIAARGITKTSAPTNDEEEVAAIAKQMEATLRRFETLGVERAEVMAYVSRMPDLDSEESATAHLIGLANAIEGNEVQIEDVFTVPESPIAEPQRVASAPKAAPAPVAAKAEPKAPVEGYPAKFSGSTCFICKKPISKGDLIYKNQELGKHIHVKC